MIPCVSYSFDYLVSVGFTAAAPPGAAGRRSGGRWVTGQARDQFSAMPATENAPHNSDPATGMPDPCHREPCRSSQNKMAPPGDVPPVGSVLVLYRSGFLQLSKGGSEISSVLCQPIHLQTASPLEKPSRPGSNGLRTWGSRSIRGISERRQRTSPQKETRLSPIMCQATPRSPPSFSSTPRAETKP